MSDTLLTETPPPVPAYPLHDTLIIDNVILHGEMNTSSETVTEHVTSAIRRGHAQVWPQPLRVRAHHDQVVAGQVPRVALSAAGTCLQEPDEPEKIGRDLPISH